MKFFRLFVVVFAILMIAACSNNSEQNSNTGSSFGAVGDFSAVTQDGEDFNVKNLEGSWWVADFIFTNCETVCLPMTANMVQLQSMLEDEGFDDVKLVSFSVDPERDTPEVLTEYANEYGADLNRWTFLTGYDFATIKDYATGTFKNLVEEPPEGSDQVTHATYFFLVDPNGNIVSHYSGTKPEQMADIVNDLKKFQ